MCDLKTVSGNNNNNQQKKNNPINLKLINIKLQRTICHMTACLHNSPASKDSPTTAEGRKKT